MITPELMPAFLQWAENANASYSRTRAAYRRDHPIKDLEQLWKPQTVSELAEWLKRRKTGRHKL